MDFQSLVEAQHAFFLTQTTKSLSFRLENLKTLKSLIKHHEKKIAQALNADLSKPLTEAIRDEVLLVITEIDLVIKNLKTWMKPKKVNTPFPALWPGKSTLHYEPYGSVLIIGPWNYPFLLIMSPLIGAIAAGNCVVIKPSEVAKTTEQLIVALINQHFPPNFIKVITGDAKETQKLLNLPFDYIFFTGGTAVGRLVMQSAAQQLIPVTLELGGKSPCIIDASANIPYAARRLMWAKTTNAGQICLAPDYVYVHSSCKEALLSECKKTLIKFFGKIPQESTSYARIINHHHFMRLVKLMQHGRIIAGGEQNEKTLFIAPTLFDEINWDDPIMQEEIFGPLLPIFTFDSLDEVIAQLQTKTKSLALYLFTQDKTSEIKVLKNISFGGGAINDCLLQIANLHLPFGGVGLSGMGNYRGHYSFKTFSHQKSIYKKRWNFDFKVEYPPYSVRKLKWLRRILQF